MKFEELVALIGDEPVFTSGLLHASAGSAAGLRVQLGRWVEAGKVVQLRRGVYTLAPPFRRVEPHPFLVANRLRPASYVSLQSALAYHGMIPEGVPTVTSVTAGRPATFETPIGTFLFRHVTRAMFRDFRPLAVATGQTAFVATPEKALLDLVHLTPRGDRSDFLAELRLQNLDELDGTELEDLARRLAAPKLQRAARRIVREIAEAA